MSLNPLTINQAHGCRTASAFNAARLVVQGTTDERDVGCFETCSEFFIFNDRLSNYPTLGCRLLTSISGQAPSLEDPVFGALRKRPVYAATKPSLLILGRRCCETLLPCSCKWQPTIATHFESPLLRANPLPARRARLDAAQGWAEGGTIRYGKNK